MLVEYELQGSTMLHKGLFDTTGFWAKFDADYCDITKEAQTYKIYSHFSFTFEHKDEALARHVFDGIISALVGNDWYCAGIGFIRTINSA